MTNLFWTYCLMIDFLIKSPSSRSASLTIKSSLFPDGSTPTKSLCSAGETNILFILYINKIWSEIYIKNAQSYHCFTNDKECHIKFIIFFSIIHSLSSYLSFFCPSDLGLSLWIHGLCSLTWPVLHCGLWKDLQPHEAPRLLLDHNSPPGHRSAKKCWRDKNN